MAETPLAQIRNCDVLVIGGGINGAGTARDLAGRGFSTLLCEKDDLAGHTSSASTKLIHGGLRYLEQYEFRLVRKALIEREVLMRCAPHLIRPLAFILPHDDSRRPACWCVPACWSTTAWQSGACSLVHTQSTCAPLPLARHCSRD